MLSLHNVTKKFGTSQPAVDCVSAEFPRGQCIGLVGTNGAGKSTLLKLMAGIWFPDGGEIVHSPSQRPLTISYKPAPLTFPAYLTVYQYLVLNAKLARSSAEAPATRVKRVAYQLALTPHLRKKLSKLSYGFRERVGFAQTILADADLKLLDEPFQGLDIESQQQAIEIIHGMKRPDKTIVLCSHRLDKVRALCDSMMVMHEGQLVHVEPITETTTEQAMYNRYQQVTHA